MQATDLAEVERAVQEAAQTRAELRNLTARRREAGRDVNVAEAALATARERRDSEADDVASLESWSPTRIWAGLRGSRASDLTQEEAELQAAEYAVASAEQRRVTAVAAEEQIDAAIQRLGDPDARFEQALADKERLLVAREIGASGELVEIAERLGELAAEQRELSEALSAARDAQRELGAAIALLENARSWSTWDTFGGGGLLTDVVKYDRMDKAAAALRGADVRLRHLRVELADVDLSGVPEVNVSQLLQTFDVWFDNIFSDWSVRSRIGDAHRGAVRARDDVHRVLGVLEGRLSETTAETDRLAARRTEILTGR